MMNRSVRFLVLLVVGLLVVTADAACRVKRDDSIGKEAEANATADNKIQDAPSSKRLVNKIAFDVVNEETAKRKRLANKIAFDVTAKSNAADDDESADEGMEYIDEGSD